MRNEGRHWQWVPPGERPEFTNAGQGRAPEENEAALNERTCDASETGEEYEPSLWTNPEPMTAEGR